MSTAVPPAARPGRRDTSRPGRRAAAATALVVLCGVAIASPAHAAPRADEVTADEVTATVAPARSGAGAPAEVEDAPAGEVPGQGPGSDGDEVVEAVDPAIAQARRELDAAVAAAEDELDTRSAAASAALEAYQDAVRARDAAALAHQRESDRLAGARAEELSADADVARWTSQAYRHGVAGGDAAELGALVGADGPQDLQRRLAGLRQVGRAEARDLLDARDSRRSAQDATRESASSSAAASVAAEEARTAREAADASVAALGEQVAALTALRAQGGGPPDGSAPLGEAPSAGAAPLAGCPPRDLGAFANGQVPLTALCPLPGAPAEVLRADAAAAFAAMSTAYAADHGGRGLCVTDAYRDLASQVAVRAAQPGLAAVPGTSQHGWGVAVDLCGGVADPSSEASAWMRAHAGLHGWFHPAWAQPGGALPEAWHWEFAG